ncbi:hypothetical protein NUW54_g12471 [Trametes sanguinea]|uniref:Uncharacterized protein n=1 Tax=Trametes sanguinea TaxID=158606 RepID=A0ACC1MX37_9APHY|nr:hypothetical protein NUW54_g12471 [Trametes sanguinea]
MWEKEGGEGRRGMPRMPLPSPFSSSSLALFGPRLPPPSQTAHQSPASLDIDPLRPCSCPTALRVSDTDAVAHPSHPARLQDAARLRMTFACACLRPVVVVVRLLTDRPCASAAKEQRIFAWAMLACKSLGVLDGGGGRMHALEQGCATSAAGLDDADSDSVDQSMLAPSS